MDYTNKVRDELYKSEINFFLTRPKIGIEEARLGDSNTNLILIYSLIVMNSCFFAKKALPAKFYNNKHSFAFLALAAYPISYFINGKLFGSLKYRTVAKRDKDTRKSVQYYLDNANLKN